MTESNVENGTEQETEKFPPDDYQIKKDKNQTSNKQDFNFRTSSSGDPPVSVLQQNCANLKPKQSYMDSQTQHQKRTNIAHHHAPIVKLRRLPFLETPITELNTSTFSVNLTKDCTQMPLQPRLLDSNSAETECIGNLRTTTASNGPHVEPLRDESPPKVIESLVRKEQQEKVKEFTSTQLNAKISPHQESLANSACSNKGSPIETSKEDIADEDERGGFCSSILTRSPTPPSSSQDKARGSFQKHVIRFLEQLELDQADSELNYLSDHPSPLSPTTELKPSEPSDLDSLSHTGCISHNIISQVQTPTSEHTLAEAKSEWQLEEVKADEASNCPELSCCNITSESPLSVSKIEDMDDGSGTGTCRGDLEVDDPVYFFWQDWSYEEQVNEESRFDTDFRAASREDRDFVCPVALSKIMSGQAQALVRDISPDVCICFVALIN